MNIATRRQQAERTNNSSKPVETVETAGSLALMPMGQKAEYLAMNSYDSFTSSNPFTVDYSNYADYGDSSIDGGFLSSFSSAISTIGFNGAAGAATASCGGGSFSSGSCGGFSSFC